MPHIIVKCYPGHTEKEKAELSKRIVADVAAVFGNGEESISVAVEDVSPSDWPEQVYRKEIMAHPERLYKKPGYRM